MLKTICPYKGAFCPNADRWYLSWWKENVNGPVEKITTAEKKEGCSLNGFGKVAVDKVYVTYSAIAAGRVTLGVGQAKVTSSDGTKT